MKLKFVNLSLLVVLLSGCWEIEKGEKIGIIVKVAQEGFFYKTYDAELIRGGLNDGSGSFGNSFHFTIENDSLLSKSYEALEKKLPVKIKYHQELFSFLRTNNVESYFLDDIEIINKENT